jgi:hypothetical protein
MVIIGMLSYSPEGAKELGKRFLAQKSLPDYISMKGHYISGAKGEGTQTITLYEVERSKLPDALEHISNRYVAYFGVPGLTYSVNIWLDAGEALKMIGLA